MLMLSQDMSTYNLAAMLVNLNSDLDDEGRYVPMDLDFTQMEQVHVPGCWNCIRDQYWYYEGESPFMPEPLSTKRKRKMREFSSELGRQIMSAVFG